MSQENVERFNEAGRAFNRLIETPGEAVTHLLAALDPNIRWEPQQSAIEGGYLGHDGVLEWLVDLAEHYESGRADYAEIRDLGDRVLALGTLCFVGKGSGIETEAPVAIVATFEGGLMTRFTDYGDTGKALEAVGLSE